ncbi:uncharacterized protein TNCV_3908381 [Trichonephila clavipes]|nr:uncharacterized protein TNCV_3908381 [Trichonephila clavipes]
MFHVLADLEHPCILGVDFVSGSKIILDFERKSLAIPDSQTDKVVTMIEEGGNVEIDLCKTGLEERQKPEFRDLFNSFTGLLLDKSGSLMFWIMKLIRGIKANNCFSAVSLWQG